MTEASPRPFSIALPFPAQINPATDSLAFFLRKWADDGATPADHARYLEARYERLVGRLFPTASGPTLRIIGPVVLWLFLYDDQLDPGGRCEDAGQADLLAGRVAELVDGDAAGEGDDPLLHLLWRWLTDISVEVPAQWWRRCAANLAGFARGLADEVEARTGGSTPGPAAYLATRRITSGWTVLTDLIELADQTELPDSLRQAPEFQRLGWAAADVACTINDLLSLRKEVDAGELHNLVLVLRRAEGCDLPSAVERTHQWMEERLGDYLRDREQLRCTRPPADRSALNSYSAGLESLMRGGLDWSMETGRYGWLPVIEASEVATR